MTQLGDWALTSSYEQFRQEASAFRNARDWAKSQRDELIAVANSRVTDILKETFTLESSIHRMSQSSIEPITLKFETLIDELSQEVGQDSRLSHKRQKRELEKRFSNPNLKKENCSKVYSKSRSKGRRS